jgi:hypothetical protein
VWWTFVAIRQPLEEGATLMSAAEWVEWSVDERMTQTAGRMTG